MTTYCSLNVLYSQVFYTHRPIIRHVRYSIEEKNTITHNKVSGVLEIRLLFEGELLLLLLLGARWNSDFGEPRTEREKIIRHR
jgi:hypothetical protein